MKRLVVEWADAVAENYAPRAMKGFGLDYDTLAAIKPDLVMISACLNGQTGPHKDYPGFGGQGSALAGYNALTGWPDREPVGPFGTITDSLAPRFVARALAAGLHYRRRTGHGVYLDVVAGRDRASWSLAPWLLDYEVDGVLRLRDGNNHRDARAARRVPVRRRGRRRRPLGRRSRAGTTTSSIALHADRGRRRRGVDPYAHPRRGGRDAAGGRDRSRAGRRTSATSTTIRSSRTAATSSRTTHPFLGDGLYERNGFRLSACPSGYDRPGPTLGQDNDWVLARRARV